MNWVWHFLCVKVVKYRFYLEILHTAQFLHFPFRQTYLLIFSESILSVLNRMAMLPSVLFSCFSLLTLGAISFLRRYSVCEKKSQFFFDRVSTLLSFPNYQCPAMQSPAWPPAFLSALIYFILPLLMKVYLTFFCFVFVFLEHLNLDSELIEFQGFFLF